mmetsp:Transcript_12761/g.36111  ORF Transcript_12761/g.36111 Transcript_12761/m.36111 type:complete len:276 (-) Transcript_12761:12-839(-)
MPAPGGGGDRRDGPRERGEPLAHAGQDLRHRREAGGEVDGRQGGQGDGLQAGLHQHAHRGVGARRHPDHHDREAERGVRAAQRAPRLRKLLLRRDPPVVGPVAEQDQDVMGVLAGAVGLGLLLQLALLDEPQGPLHACGDVCAAALREPDCAELRGAPEVGAQHVGFRVEGRQRARSLRERHQLCEAVLGMLCVAAHTGAVVEDEVEPCFLPGALWRPVGCDRQPHDPRVLTELDTAGARARCDRLSCGCDAPATHFERAAPPICAGGLGLLART